MMYNIWLQSWAKKNIKAKCKFVLYEIIYGSLKYHKWSEVYWTNISMTRHKHVIWDDMNNKLIWVMPNDCHINGFCIIHDDKGELLKQSISGNTGGIDLYRGEQIQIDTSGIQILP